MPKLSIARAPKAEDRERGLYKNGARWWLRVKNPETGDVKPTSTGTDDLRMANRIARMVREIADGPRTQWEWLADVVAGRVTLAELYLNRSGGTLAELRQKQQAAQHVANDHDLRPFVQRWVDEHLALKIANNKLRPVVAKEYERQVRVLIPADAPFPRSCFTEDTIKAALGRLVHHHTGKPATGSTRVRYLAAWRLFYKWARRPAKLGENPFDDETWQPTDNPARLVSWDHETRVRVLAKMDGAHRVAMTLALGAGVELSALKRMTVADVSTNAADRVVWAPGTKSDARARMVFVDRWAWPAVHAFAQDRPARELLFAGIDWSDCSRELRNAFYRAQLAAGVVAKPPRSPKTSKLLWDAVGVHRIHDSRHTYAVCRGLGLDGEEAQSAKWVAGNLGHSTERMVLDIYGKLRVEDRVRLMQQQRAAVGA